MEMPIKTAKTIEKLINWLIVLLAFILPLFFLPVTTEFYVFNKQTLLTFATGMLLVLWALKMVAQKKVSWVKTPLDWPVLLLAAAYLLATILVSPNKVNALMHSTGTGVILTLTLLYFAITNNLTSRSVKAILRASMISASLVGLIAVYQFIGLGEALAPAEWMKTKLWTPLGGPLILLTFLGANLALAVVSFLKKFNQKGWLTATWFFLASVLISLGLFFTLWQVLPFGGSTATLMLLPYRAGWAIAIEAFKQSPLLGMGPGNYLSAFNRFRPISFNNYDFWDARFNLAPSLPFQLLTVTGLIGLAAYLLLVLRVIKFGVKNYRQSQEKPLNINQIGLTVFLLAWLVIQLLLPPNLLILTFTFICLAFFSLSQEKVSRASFVSKNLSLVVLGLGVILVGVGSYFWGRAWLADWHFRQSLTALVQNQGTQTYNAQIRAFSLNPQKQNYRIAYSQTNFALANALAAQPDLSDQDRNNISQFIQQAIQEAKIATTLNPADAGGWENLAQLYRNLINFAQGADQWAIAAYRQAILTDPINPRLRLNLGGLFFSLGNYAEAIRHFENAINLKPDFANAYYNLAVTYREQQEYQLAFNAMQAVINLVPADSPDYQKAVSELEDLRAQLPAETLPEEPAPKELTPPEPLPSPVIEPPIELPEEAGPEVAPSPTVEPIPTITPTPTQ